MACGELRINKLKAVRSRGNWRRYSGNPSIQNETKKLLVCELEHEIDVLKPNLYLATRIEICRYKEKGKEKGSRKKKTRGIGCMI